MVTPSRPQTEIPTRPLAPSAVGRAGALLARAFGDDPLFAHVLPDPARRARRLPALLGSLVRYGVRYGRVDTVGDTLDGVALWLPPGRTAMSPGRMLRTGVATAPLRLGREGLARFGAFLRATEAAHRRVAPGPHWYLLLLAVEPSRQRRGLGAGLIRPVLDAADQARVPCYLETLNPATIGFYQRHGFDIAAHEVINPGGPPFWGMLRTPRS